MNKLKIKEPTVQKRVDDRKRAWVESNFDNWLRKSKEIIEARNILTEIQS